MATKQITIYIDDLDGTESTIPNEIRTVEFGIDGTSYEIDLTDTNADQLRELLAPYREAARLTGRAQAGRPAAVPAVRNGDVLDPKAVRAWAREHGYTVSPRGRIPLDVQQAYRADQVGDASPRQHQDTRLQEAERVSDDALVIVSEEEAARHYEELPVPAGREKNWAKREGSGCDRTMRIADMTLMERIEALTDFNLKVLGQLTGDIPVKNGRVKGLGTSGARLLNFEFIDDEYQLTPFGRYAYRVRALNAAA
ncbi:histone-like nucleoid-structuring protein Lsr2 [Streptomyces vinaceus]|uniref:histone-like nucleoid-structuring protein Lsr2 n=1 Tax=Streptomyces vinaceus TaxID=1960 RepID=UPI0036A522F2